MNATELADYIETGGENIDRKELATMLRQQQAEIESLKAKMSPNSYDDAKNVAIQLTDEEIHQVIFNLPNKDLDLFEFARAILRKAQEKWTYLITTAK